MSDPADFNHAAASSFFGGAQDAGVSLFATTDYVLRETYTLVRMRIGMGAVRQFVRLLGGSSSIRVLWVDAGRHDAALRLPLKRRDKRWSHTDCTSFVMMETLGIPESFAFDRNFEQAGFIRRP